MARTFTREQFYELVWARPMTHLAKEFAISDVALHKICRKHDIPNPPLGWWAKKAASKQVKQTPLPPLKPDVSDRITIVGGHLMRENEALAHAREGARVTASANEATQPQSHPVVDRTIQGLRKAKMSDRGVVSTSGNGLINCEIAPASIDRLETALPRIIAATSVQGFRLMAKGGSPVFVGMDETIGFSVSEHVARKEHVLTPLEQKKLDEWEKKRSRGRKRHEWEYMFAFDRPKFPDWDYHPTGKLAFEFEHVSLRDSRQPPRRSFRDAKTQHLETLADDIAVGLVVLAVAKKEDRRRREAWERQQEEERQRGEAEARAAYIEKRRAAALEDILSEVEELEHLERVIASLEQRMNGGAPSARVSMFMEWARKRLEMRREALSPDKLEEWLREQELFGDNDEHFYEQDHWR